MPTLGPQPGHTHNLVSNTYIKATPTIFDSIIVEGNDSRLGHIRVESKIIGDKEERGQIRVIVIVRGI